MRKGKQRSEFALFARCESATGAPYIRSRVTQDAGPVADGCVSVARASEPVDDDTGREVIPRGKTLIDEEILTMNWMVDGVTVLHK